MNLYQVITFDHNGETDLTPWMPWDCAEYVAIGKRNTGRYKATVIQDGQGRSWESHWVLVGEGADHE